MRILKSHCALTAAMLCFGLAPAISGAQDNDRAPIIRIHSQGGSGVASNYVTPAIDLAEDAYVFAVAIDLNGEIQVLQPEFPGISVRIRRDQELRLPNFFGGYSQSGGGIVVTGRYSDYSTVGGEEDTRGTVIALASRRPFNLERIERAGDWNVVELRNLLRYRSPLSAADALAAYLGQPGEPIGRDYMRFASTRAYQYGGYSDALYSCDLYYGAYNPGLAFNRIAVLDHVARLQRGGQNVRIMGYDFCGMPIVAYGPRRSVAGGHPRPPREPADSGKTKGDHFPRHPGNGDSGTSKAALGYFPLPGRTTIPQTPGVIASPPPRSPSTAPVLLDRRNQPATGVIPERRVAPTEHVPPPRTQGAATGTVQTPQYSRPIPREAPPAPRTEPTRTTAPPPRIEPTRTASPPPRMETPRYNPPAATSQPTRVESKPASPPPRH